MKSQLFVLALSTIFLASCEKEVVTTPNANSQTGGNAGQITYPATYDSMDNVLSGKPFTITGGVKFGITAEVPSGIDLKINFSYLPNQAASFGFWDGENENWEIHRYADSTVITAHHTSSGTKIYHIPGMFGPSAHVRMRVYEYGINSIPSRDTIIGW